MFKCVKSFAWFHSHWCQLRSCLSPLHVLEHTCWWTWKTCWTSSIGPESFFFFPWKPGKVVIDLLGLDCFRNPCFSLVHHPSPHVCLCQLLVLSIDFSLANNSLCFCVCCLLPHGWGRGCTNGAWLIPKLYLANIGDHVSKWFAAYVIGATAPDSRVSVLWWMYVFWSRSCCS